MTVTLNLGFSKKALQELRYGVQTKRSYQKITQALGQAGHIMLRRAVEDFFTSPGESGSPPPLQPVAEQTDLFLPGDGGSPTSPRAELEVDHSTSDQHQDPTTGTDTSDKGPG